MPNSSPLTRSRFAGAGLARPLAFVGAAAVFVTFLPTTTVPEPSTWALLGAGLLATGGAAVRRRWGPSA